MLKTDEHLLPLSTKQQYTHDQYQKKNKAKQRKIENAIMFGSMNPLYGAAASTVASSQGSTYRSEVLLNMNKIGGGDQLVGMTRPMNLKIMSSYQECQREHVNKSYKVMTCIHKKDFICKTSTRITNFADMVIIH